MSKFEIELLTCVPTFLQLHCSRDKPCYEKLLLRISYLNLNNTPYLICTAEKSAIGKT